MTTTTTTEESGKLTITMSERQPITIVKGAWPVIARGEDWAGQHGFQAFDGAWIRVRQHTDGRLIVYGYAGDWDGGGRPERENRRAGFLVEAGDDVVRAIRRVAGILAETDMVGEEMAHAAARHCIADLPAEEGLTVRPYTLNEALFILSHVYCVHCLPDDDGWIYPWMPGAGAAECSRCPCTERQDLRLHVATERKALDWLEKENAFLSNVTNGKPRGDWPSS